MGHNYLLYLWGYTTDLPENWQDLDRTAKAGADAMNQATGVNYTVGGSSNALYPVSGEILSL